MIMIGEILSEETLRRAAARVERRRRWRRVCLGLRLVALALLPGGGRA